MNQAKSLKKIGEIIPKYSSVLKESSMHSLIECYISEQSLYSEGLNNHEVSTLLGLHYPKNSEQVTNYDKEVLKFIEAFNYIKKLKEVADSFVPPRFKRPYVRDLNDGVPLLQGTHIPQIKPLNIKYIWKKMRNIKAYIVRKNWILVTCSGTIGRLTLVSNYWDGWTATNHLLRIIPKEKEINPGYLAGFLLTIYGQVQFQRLVYGGVVDEIGEAGELFNDILVLKPKNRFVEDKIGSLVIEAYNKKDKANQIEEKTIKKLEKTLTRIAENV
jgi:hypothetical protein